MHKVLQKKIMSILQTSEYSTRNNLYIILTSTTTNIFLDQATIAVHNPCHQDIGHHTGQDIPQLIGDKSHHLKNFNITSDLMYKTQIKDTEAATNSVKHQEMQLQSYKGNPQWYQCNQTGLKWENHTTSTPNPRASSEPPTKQKQTLRQHTKFSVIQLITSNDAQ